MSIDRVALIYDDTDRPDTTGVYCRRALERLVAVEHFQAAELERIPSQGFDLYLNIDDGLRYQLPDKLRPAAWWTIDTHIDFQWCLTKSQGFDLVFAAQRDGAARLRDEGIDQVTWLPLAADPEIHLRHQAQKQFDVCFLGNLFPGPRTDLLDLVRRRYRNTFVGRRHFDEMAKTYSASRIVFNRSVKNDVNMRVFEALACGSLLMTNDLSENGQEELFRDGVHLATYREPEELLEKIAYYLQKEDVRRRIESAGREEVLAKHTYLHRMKQILAKSEGRPSRKMTPQAPPSRYEQVKDGSYFEFARPEIVALVPTTARRVLEIGCASGRLGEALKARQPVEVTGLELDEEAARLARDRIDHVVVGDIERLASDFQDDSFDCIVCGDVLEHLSDPTAVLRKARSWLVPDGRLVASIPNVRHHSVVGSLLSGNWTYEPAGLLDDTHLRFFTRENIEELFESAGFEIVQLQGTPGPGYENWQRQGRPGEVRVGRLAVNDMTIQQAEEFFVYQYLVVAQALDAPASDEVDKTSPAENPSVTAGKPTAADLPLAPAPSPQWQVSWDGLIQDDWLRNKLDRNRRLQEHLDYVDQYVPDFWTMKPGLVIDLGPGLGELLEMARWKGHECLGVDAPTGAGGMGTPYLEACRLMWQRQSLQVDTTGAPHFFANGFGEHLGGQAVASSPKIDPVDVRESYRAGGPERIFSDVSKTLWY